MDTEETGADQKSGNGVLFAIGSVLWVVAFIAIYFIWVNRGDGESSNLAGTGDPISEKDLVGDETDPGEEPDENDDGKVETPVVELTWPESGVADFTFTDQSGQQVSRNDLLGKPWIASFIFTKCAGPCPKVTVSMQSMFRKYVDQGVRFVSFTVDPGRDTPEVLAQYAAHYEADPETWFFLTGDRDRIYGIIHGSFLMPAMEDPNPKPGYEIIHTTNVCLVDPTGRVVGKYNSTDGVEMVKLRRDLKKMLESTPKLDDSSADEADES
ncbi:MAG: SCO family protein [Planctomycetes bacterium]|nr:SCO family protein [Planctomycetota bacterium]